MDTTDILSKRLATMRELRSLTGTMRDLSAINVRLFEHAANAINEHARVIEHGFSALAINTAQYTTTKLSRSANKARIVILLGSDHGLCGRFSERLVNYASSFQFPTRQAGGISLAQMSNNEGGPDPGPLRVISVGDVVFRECENQDIQCDTLYSLPGVVEGIPQLVRSLLLELDQWLEQHPTASVHVFHQRTSSTGLDPQHYQLLPIIHGNSVPGSKWPGHKLPGISLPGPELLVSLIHEHLFVSLYRACAESQAAEHASRFASMQAANRNIDEQVTALAGQMHQQRQATITSELLDTMAGYESIVKDVH